MRAGTALLVILLAASLFAATGNGAAGKTQKTQFVTSRVPLNQSVKNLLRGKFTQTVTCWDSCQVIARIFIEPQVARRLGFKGVKAGQPYAIGLKQVRLAGKKPTRVRVTLGRDAKKRLPKWKQKLRLTGETYASSRSSSDRGQANWITMLRR